MKKLLMALLAATAICGTCLFTSCKKDVNLNLEKNIIGKWMFAERNGEPTPTNKKRVFTFVSTTKAYVSASRNTETAPGGIWVDHSEADVAINDKELTADLKVIVTFDGTVERTSESFLSLTKLTADYRSAIVGTWQGRCTSAGSVFDDGQEHRWEYRADGAYIYYRQENGQWVPYDDEVSEYFVDGNLLCTRWGNNGQENREWWEITIDAGRMKWTALRQNPDGTTFTATFEMEKVN